MAPLGYRKVRDAISGPTLEPDPERAPLVRDAFQLMATGAYKISELVKVLDEKGLRNRNGRPVSGQALGQLLRNPRFVGRLTVTAWGKDIFGDYEPLVASDVFHRVQSILAGKRPTAIVHDRLNPDFPLRRTIKCKCGRPFTGSWSKGRRARYPYYKCPSSCRGATVRKEVLEQQFVALLDSLAPSAPAMRLFSSIVEEVWAEKRVEESRSVARLERRRQDLLRERRRVFQLLKDEVIDGSRWKEEDAEMERVLTETTNELSALNVSVLDVKPLLDFAASILMRPAELWLSADPEGRSRFQNLAFPSGNLTYVDGRIETAQTGLLYAVFGDSAPELERMVDQTGIEPVTS